MNTLAMTLPADKTEYVSMSVVVCAYTDARFALLVRCLDAVVEQLGPRDQLVVVIDYNDDLYHSVVGRYGDVALVTKNINSRGLSGARNAGVKAAACDVVAFVDDDAQIQPGWSRRLREHYRDPSVAGIGGYANPVWPGYKPRWFPDEYYWVVGCSHRGLPTDVTPVRNFIGCNMSFRRSVFNDVGDFNADMGRALARQLRRVVTQPTLRQSMRAAARINVLARHRIEPQAQRNVDVIRAMCDRRSNGADMTSASVPLRKALERYAHGGVAADSVALTVTSGSTAATGFVFWAHAARALQPSVLGVETALSLMMTAGDCVGEFKTVTGEQVVSAVVPRIGSQHREALAALCRAKRKDLEGAAASGSRIVSRKRLTRNGGGPDESGNFIRT